jgi:chromosome segregation ATPase
MDLESLRKMFDETQKEYEEAKAHVYRCEGVIKLLVHQIQHAEAEATTPAEAPPPTE